MPVIDCKEASLHLEEILNRALSDEIIITSKDRQFMVSPLPFDGNVKKSPFAGVKGHKVNITTKEIVELLREGRAGV